VEIPLTQGKVTVIDDVHVDLAGLGWYAGRKGKTFYAQRSVRKPEGGWKTEYLHAVIAGRMGIVGPPDHRDRNGLNNRESNLRPDPDGHNQANQDVRANNTSGYRGVCFHKASGRLMAYIKIDGKQRYLGLYDDPIEAAKAYDREAPAAFGEFAVLNFPAACSRASGSM